LPSSARPSPSSAVDSCLIGTWRTEAQDLINTINNSPVQFTGSSATDIYRPDGTVVTDYGGGTVFTATVNGVEWADVFRGEASGHWDTQNGMLLFSAISARGSWTLEDNGEYNNGGPLSIEPGAVPYKCAGNTLREFFPNGSAVLIRQPAARPTVTPAGS
jgi:molecular chaperone DnaK